MSTKNEIFDYVMNSPENTNAAVLKSMLDDLEGGGTMEDFIITYTVNLSRSDEYIYFGTMDKEWNDIAEAYLGGKRVIFKLLFPNVGTEYSYNLSVTSDAFVNGELSALCFTSFIYPLNGDNEGAITVTIYEDYCQVRNSVIPFAKEWEDIHN